VALLSTATAFGQRVSFGFVGGTHLTRDFPISRTIYFDESHPEGLTTFDLYSESRSFLAGLSVEIDLGKGFSLEGNALRRNLRLGRRFGYPGGSSREDGELAVSTWQWPILAKYRLPLRGTVRPFLEAGPSFRTRHNPASTEPSQFGGTVGTGAEFRLGRFRVSPALRYTRWRYDGDYPRIATKRDQIEVVTGFSYATSVPSWRLGDRKLRFGLIGGTPLTGGIKQLRLPERIDEAQGYIGGLAIEVELNRRLSIEVNGLYRPFRANQYAPFESPGIGPVPDVRFEFTVVTWQFPVLAKYRLRPASKVCPVLVGGPSFRAAGNLNGFNPSRYGFTTGGGIETHYKTMKISPVGRYTRWAADPVVGPMNSWRTAANQVEILFSFTF
jgi:hypothetical protein